MGLLFLTPESRHCGCLVLLQQSAELLCDMTVGKLFLGLLLCEVLKHMINLVVNKSSHRLEL